MDSQQPNDAIAFIEAVKAINETYHERYGSILREIDRLATTTDKAIERLNESIIKIADRVEERIAAHELKDDLRFDKFSSLIYPIVGGLILLSVLIPILIKFIWR